jgi:glycosyltransferase involved in cell wall biosynthesis
VLVNAAGSRSGGGRVYVLALIEELSRGGDRGLEWEFIIDPALAGLIARPCGVRVEERPSQSVLRRIAWEQLALPIRARRRFDVLVSGANFGPLAYRRRHVLLQRNSLYFADAAFAGLAGLRIRLEERLAKASVHGASAVVTGSEHMAGMVAPYSRERPVCIPFGPGLVGGRNGSAGERFRFLHRTYWGPHKRFADLLMAVRELARHHEGAFRLRTACDPRTAFARRFQESRAERQLLEDPAVSEHVEFIDFAPRHGERLAGDAVVMPSVTESFCFPIAEAVGADLPVIAADTPFARELCGGAGVFVTPCDPAELAAGMREVLEGQTPPPFPAGVHERISWAAHADGLASLCRAIAADGAAPAGRSSSTSPEAQ